MILLWSFAEETIRPKFVQAGPEIRFRDGFRQ